MRSLSALFAFAALFAGCVQPQPKKATATFSKKASKSGPIALSEDEKWVVMVNPDDDSISIFDAGSNQKTATLKTGDEPWAVVIAGDSKTAYVANRAAATVVKITGIDTSAPEVKDTVETGSEPLAIALSPSGALLYVAEWAEGRISAIDTATMVEAFANDAPRNPRALAVTNNGDENDADELVIMPEFFGEPIGTEATNESRQGVVRIYNATDLQPNPNPIVFPPLATGFNDGVISAATDPIRGAGNPVKASPNQLGSVAISANKIFVTSVAAAPAGKAQFNNNVYPFVLVGDLGSRAPVDSLSVNLLDKIVAQTDLGTVTPTNNAKRLAMGDIVDLAFVGDRNVAYVVSRAADGVQRVVFGESGPTLGATQAFQIDVTGDAGTGNGCKNPVGIAVKADGTKAFVHCWVSRKLGVIDLTSQALATVVESSAFPSTGTDAEKAQKGKRFYFTGRGRWSKNGEGWSSCGSCHPDGLTDNMTWVFGAGPRQTTSQDGSFSHGARAGKRRVFNWTGIFDEHHDFERNVRNVSGGLGAITKPKAGKTPADCGNVANEDPIPFTVDGTAMGAAIDGLGKPLKVQQDTPPGDNGCKLKDWDELDEFVKTIRPPQRLKKLDPAAVEAGRQIFQGTGGCNKCHGGAGWTLSRRFFEPSEARNTALGTTEMFSRPAALAPFNEHTGTQVADQPNSTAATGAKPRQVACVIRKVDTFSANAALETKDDGQGAQGKSGYNIPSLYGLAVGAPYLHHGGAKTLEELFSASEWQKHTEAGAANFQPSAKERADLIAFLLSIDENQSEVDPPAGFEACPAQ